MSPAPATEKPETSQTTTDPAPVQEVTAQADQELSVIIDEERATQGDDDLLNRAAPEE